MRKRFLAGFLAMCMVLPLAACSDTKPTSSSSDATKTSKEGSTEKEKESKEVSADGMENGKFTETRKITVEVYDRQVEGGSDVTNNKFTKYIQDGMKEKYNVEVSFVAVPRWTEVDELNNHLAAGTAPNICVTYDYPTIQSYANMGGVQDLAPYLEQYKDMLPNLYSWLGDTNINWDKDIKTGTIYAIEGKRATTNRVVTFVRKDWLDKLNMKEPTTKKEFEDMLIAFRDNADTLLGADADKMIPFALSSDVGWRAATLIESFIDPQISDYDYYVNGFDDRKLTEPGTKDAIKLLNEWYHKDLIYKDFALSSDTEEEDNRMKAGFVGAFTHNWDYPFRNGDQSINNVLSSTFGDDAMFVAIDPFEDKNGGHNKFVTSTAGDRKIFFPTSNTEPLASMLYLDFISSPDVIEYLQIGDKGVNHNVLDDGAIEVTPATGDDIQNSGMNIDYTITCNGLHLKDDAITAISTAHNYPGIPADVVKRADEIANTDARRDKNIKVAVVNSEDGMGTALGEKRDQVYNQCIICDTAEFDEKWDYWMKDYLQSGGQDIIDERQQVWKDSYGDATSVD